MMDIGNPDISIGLFIDPAAVVGQLFLIFGDGGRQVSGGAPPGEESVSGFIPLIEAVGAGVEPLRIGEDFAAGGDELFPGLDQDGALFAGGFNGPFVDEDSGLVL